MKLFYYLTLMRPANTITAISDIIAGVAIAGFLILPAGDFNAWPAIALLMLSTIGLYGGGIVFNDIFDYKADAITRPERILPRGLVTMREAKVLGGLLLTGGICAATAVSQQSGIIAAIVAALALSYDKISKHYPVIGPLNMGMCRGGNLMLGMSIHKDFALQHWYIGIIPIIFIAAITLTALKETAGRNKTTIMLAMVLDALVVILFGVIGRTSGLDIMIALPFLLLWYGMNFIAKYRAYRENQPALIQKAVKTGVLSLIFLNASYVAGSAGWMYALPVLLLLPLCILLAKKFAVT